MQKLMIVKGLSIFMGICIIACMMCIVGILIKSNIGGKSEQKQIQPTELTVFNNGKIKDFTISEGKIYLLLSSSDKDEIVVIKENTAKEILNIRVVKEAENGQR